MKNEPMLHRVARAIAQTLNPGSAACSCGNCRSLPQRYVNEAEAAIAAMREPTRAMLEAAGGAMTDAKRPTPARVGNRAKHGIRYRAMIDAALKEKRT